ncbi:MAG: ABC transporter ATP-binding protein [Oscillospiraceae bacterium]|nr:ABC transporter ATP-binding protein [Oscillospiraceae bacterium]
MKYVAACLKPRIPFIVFGFIVKFAGTVMDLLLPMILSYMIDNIVPQKSVGLIAVWGLVMIVCALLAFGANVAANRMASKTARDAALKIRSDLFEKISYLSCAALDRFTVPSLISRVSADTYNIHNMIGMVQRLGVRTPILLMGGIAVAFTVEPVLTLVLMAVMPFIGAVVYFVARRGIRLYDDMQKTIDTMVRCVRENIGGIRVIKALSKTEYEKKRFDGINRAVAESDKKAGLNMSVSGPSINFLLNFGMIAVILIGAYRVNEGICTPGKIIAFMLYFTIMLNAVMSINRIFTVLSKGSASAERISRVIEEEDDTEIIPYDKKEGWDYISFENVSFSYDKTKPAVDNISFSIKKGEKLGIIGTTGSGKTTLISLLLRFYDTDTGVIRIDGENIRSIPLQTLRRKFAAAFQNDFLMSDTIENNIDFGRGIRKEKIRESAGAAQAAEFITGMPEGFEYKVGIRGGKLSGGQKQRLFISRAFAGDPEILILDDSSSALDYKTEGRLRKEISTRFADTTVIIVAQRISSVKDADKILVTDNGAAVGFGDHEHLMKNCPQYAAMEHFQRGGAENEA